MFRTPKFNPTTDLPDLAGKIIVVTGANTGIGYTTVRNLARKGAKVYLGSRSREKGQAAVLKLEAEGVKPENVVLFECDLGTPVLAKASAENFLKCEDRLDILINNAACTYDETDKPGQDGITEMMMTNHIGTFQFTQTLLPLLKKTAEQPNSDVRIITLSSSTHMSLARPMDPKLSFSSLDSFKETYQSDAFPFISRYSISKLANILFTTGLQKRVPHNIICISLHPGAVKSTFASQYRFYRILNTVVGWFGMNVDEGSFTTCFAAASPVVKKDSDKYAGKYLVPFGVVSQPSENAQRVDLEEQLWQTTEKYLEGCNLD